MSIFAKPQGAFAAPQPEIDLAAAKDQHDVPLASLSEATVQEALERHDLAQTRYAALDFGALGEEAAREFLKSRATQSAEAQMVGGVTITATAEQETMAMESRVAATSADPDFDRETRKASALQRLGAFAVRLQDRRKQKIR